MWDGIAGRPTSNCNCDSIPIFNHMPQRTQNRSIWKFLSKNKTILTKPIPLISLLPYMGSLRYSPSGQATSNKLLRRLSIKRGKFQESKSLWTAQHVSSPSLANSLPWNGSFSFSIDLNTTDTQNLLFDYFDHLAEMDKSNL